MKKKHNGGNKTQREKLAKNLIICKAQGINIPAKLDINLPPGIVKQKAEQIKKNKNIDIDVSDLELNLKLQNRISE